MAEFKHFDLKIVAPKFDSPLIDLIIELDKLRERVLYGSTKPIIFYQLKQIFHMLESLASARIEGNNTTVADYIETKIEQSPKSNDIQFREIQNMEVCLDFIEENIEDSKIDRAFISELHKIVTENLPFKNKGEGDETPGAYRSKQVSIANSSHIPPEPVTVSSYMEELCEFVKTEHESKYDLLKTSLVHHRFVWIHPFNNGNGRTVRMLTYAMLIKYGFSVQAEVGRILNPAAVFCNDRKEYYAKLALADKGTDENVLKWCEYVLGGLKTEIEKIDRLLEYDFLQKRILYPAIAIALDRAWITEIEFKVLKKAVDKQIIKAADLSDVILTKHPPELSRIIRRLKDKKMLIAVSGSPRKYAICFQNNYLIRGIIEQLSKEGFVSIN